MVLCLNWKQDQIQTVTFQDRVFFLIRLYHEIQKLSLQSMKPLAAARFVSRLDKIHKMSRAVVASHNLKLHNPT